jgi:site-specific recombinase XerD
MRIEQALEKFLVQLEADGRSPHTINQYLRHVTAFAEWARSNEIRGDVDAITHEDAARFLASKAARNAPDGRPKKATSANALRASLKVFFLYLHRAGITERDAGRLIRRAITSAGPPKCLTIAEQERLLETLANGESFEDRRDAVLFAFMLRSGARVGSTVALNVEDVDIHAQEVRIHAKGDRTEKIYLSAETAEQLREWIGDRRDGPLFATRFGARITTRQVARRLRCRLERAGITRAASPHSLRHSFATALYRRTGDLLMTKAALGHRSIASTLIYAHVDRERLRKAMA